MKKDQKVPEKAAKKVNDVKLKSSKVEILTFEIHLTKQKESVTDAGGESQSNQQIIDSKSFIVIDIKFEKPLIPRKPFEQLVNRFVFKYILSGIRT